MKYGKAPLSSLSQNGGIVRRGQSARTVGPGLELSLVLQLLPEKRWEAIGLLVVRNEIRTHTAKNREAMRLLRSK